MKKNRTILIFIISIITTVLAICVFIFFLKVIKNKNQHTSVVLSTLSDKLKEKENATMFATKIQEIKSLQNSINERFVKTDKIDTFVEYLEEIGKSFGTEVSVEKIEVPPTKKNLIAIQISIIGTFSNVIKTMSFIENIPYQVNVTELYLNQNTDKEIQTWQADMSFNVVSLN